MRLILVLSILTCLTIDVLAKKMAYVTTGVDTMISGIYGPNNFDFVLERPCTSMTDPGCHSQMDFQTGYSIGNVNSSLMSIGYGKINLDSIHTAPPDSLMSDHYNTNIGTSNIFATSFDSLELYEGNVYVFKTTIVQPFNCPLYVKIKFLDFDILNLADRKVRVIFLWVADICTGPVLTTPAPVDTFPDLSIFDPEPTQIRDMSQRTVKSNSSGSKSVNRQIVLGNKFTVPESWGNANPIVGIYDLNGKLVGKVNVFGKRVIDLKKELGIKAGGVLVVQSKNEGM